MSIQLADGMHVLEIDEATPQPTEPLVDAVLIGQMDGLWPAG